jgi:hypothetical protein
MPDIDVKSYIDQLREALPYVPPIPVEEIRALHREGDLGGVVKLVRRTMNVNVRLTLHWTSGPSPTGIPNALAWVSRPEKMPYYGTAAFRETSVDMFIRKQFAASRPFEEFAIAAAHELSHIVLDSVEHPLRKEEKAVDLTAMLLGFSQLYYGAAHTTRKVTPNLLEKRQLGYLSESEMERAASILVPRRARAKRATGNLLRNCAGVLGLATLCLIGWAIGFASDTEVHKLAMAEQARIQGEVPWGSNAYMSLIGASAGLSSVTIKYVLTDQIDNMVAFERRVRAAACATNGTNIRKGLSYIYEYRSPSGYIARFNVSSCP